LPEKAKAAVLVSKNAPFEIREYNLTTPEKKYALLKLKASGICGTDLHIHSGKLGEVREQIIGHEFIGEVVAIDPADSKSSGIKTGDNAIVYIAVACGECLLCRSGDGANCANMKVTNGGSPEDTPHFHGGFAEYSYAPVENLIKLPEDIEPLTAGVFACPGPTVFHAFSIMRRAGFDPGGINTAVVQGTGPVGCFAVLYLKSLGVKNIIAVSKNIINPGLITLLGASEIIDISEISEKTDGEIAERVRYISGPDLLGADLVFEASGNPAALALGIGLLRNRGVYLIPGQYSNSGGINIQPQLITFKALALLGSSQYDMSDIAGYIAFLQKNRHLHDLIKSLASRYKITEINQAFCDIKNHKNIKSVLC
jgi:threonine dehydrogenase-like Zn-dependent dehydrogenase